MSKFFVFLIPFFQVNVLPFFSFVVSPFFLIYGFLLLVVRYISACKKERGFRLPWNAATKSFALIFSLSLVYALISVAFKADLFEVVKFLFSLFFAFVFYVLGYYFFGLKRGIVFRLLYYSFVFFVFVGLAEILFMFLGFSDNVINGLRNVLLTYNIDKNRLHLFFSEPSFLATYFLCMLFVINNGFDGLRKNVLVFFVLLFSFFSFSIYVFAVIFSFYFFYAIKVVRKRYVIYFYSLLLVSVTFFVMFTEVGHRILNYDQDMSIYVRWINFFTLYEMGSKNFFLGSGLGFFGQEFVSRINDYDFSGIAELENIANGTVAPVPLSMSMQVFAFLGLPGLVLFLKMIKGNGGFFAYRISLFIATLSALPWALPFIWVLLGFMDKLSLERGEGSHG